MGDANIFISNGTCYSAAGKKLDRSFIPCGNAAFGHQTCYRAGDNCLGDKACFGVHGTGYGSYLTYMAGCTDPDYKDGSCPDKKGIAKAGIGVGAAAAAVLLFLAAIIALFLHHRRKRRADGAEVENASVAGGGAPSHASNKHNSMDQPPSDISEADGQPARPWSMRSELEGSQVPGTGLASGSGSGSGKEEGVGGGGDGMLSPIAELPGSAPPPGPPGQGYGGDGREGRRRVVVGDSVVYL